PVSLRIGEVSTGDQTPDRQLANAGAGRGPRPPLGPCEHREPVVGEEVEYRQALARALHLRVRDAGPGPRRRNEVTPRRRTRGRLRGAGDQRARRVAEAKLQTERVEVLLLVLDHHAQPFTACAIGEGGLHALLGAATVAGEDAER